MRSGHRQRVRQGRHVHGGRRVPRARSRDELRYSKLQRKYADPGGLVQRRVDLQRGRDCGLFGKPHLRLRQRLPHELFRRCELRVRLLLRGH